MGNGGWYDQKTLDTDRPSHGSHDREGVVGTGIRDGPSETVVSG
jgi:hypothetical protein